MTVRDYCLRWLDTRTARLAPNAVRAYRSALLHHVIPCLGDIALATLTTRDVRAWLQDALRGRPANAVRAWHSALSTVLTDAVLDGELATNVAHGAGRRIYASRLAVPPKALVPAQVHALIVASRLTGSAWAPDALTVYSRTGLRLGELAALSAADVLADGLRVERTYHGAGRFGPPKNGRARIVECSPGTRRVLERLVDQATPPDRWLFPGRAGRPLSPAAIESAFRQAAAIAQLPGHYTVHSLRHTYASLLLAHGAPAQYVQAQLGHAHYAITVDLYGSWLRTPRPDLVALLDAEPSRNGTTRLERPPVPRGVVLPMARHRR